MKRQGSSGFTLLELIISLVVMGILSGFSYRVYQAIWKKTKSSQHFMNACRWRQALLDYYEYQEKFPTYCEAGQWFNFTSNFSSFMNEFSKDGSNEEHSNPKVFCYFTPEERSETNQPTVWFWCGTNGTSPDEIMKELERTCGRKVPSEKVFGWGTEVLFYLPGE